jgi:hypothetical protein
LQNRTPPRQRAGVVERLVPLTAGLLSQDRRFSRRVHKCQFVGESFALSLNDGPIFLCFLLAINNLDRLPRCNMQVLAGTEDPVQHAAYGA